MASVSSASLAEDWPASTTSTPQHQDAQPRQPVTPPIGTRIDPKLLFMGSYTPDFLQRHVRERITAGELLALPEKERRPEREKLGLTKGEVDCYAVIQRRVVHKGVAIISNAELARILKVKPRMVRNYIARLVQLGLIERQRVGLGQVNRYSVLSHPWMWEDPASLRGKTTGSERQSTASAAHCSAAPERQSTASFLEDSEESTHRNIQEEPPFSPPIQKDRGDHPRRDKHLRLVGQEDQHPQRPHNTRTNPRARGDNPRAVAAREARQREEEAWHRFWQSATGQQLWTAVTTHDDCTRSHADPYRYDGCLPCRDLIAWAKELQRREEVPPGVLVCVEWELEQRRKRPPQAPAAEAPVTAAAPSQPAEAPGPEPLQGDLFGWAALQAEMEAPERQAEMEAAAKAEYMREHSMTRKSYEMLPEWLRQQDIRERIQRKMTARLTEHFGERPHSIPLPQDQPAAPQAAFEDFRASEVLCTSCGRSHPVSRLGNTNRCTVCGSITGYIFSSDEPGPGGPDGSQEGKG